MLHILHEDDALLFVNKPPHVVVQRGHDLEERVLFEEAQKHTSPLFLLQRLDRGTTGVLFFSKLSAINTKLTRQFEKKLVRKQYLAIVHGELRQKQTIDAPLARIGAIKFGVRDHGLRAITHVTPLATGNDASLVSVVLETGRTHQIRAHLAAIGHSLAGDWLYGERSEERPMLHSLFIELTHPLTNQRIRVDAPPPADFLRLAAALGLSSGLPSSPADVTTSGESNVSD